MDKCISTTFSTSSKIASHNPFSVIKVDAQPHQHCQTVSVFQGFDKPSNLILPVPTTFPEWTVGEKFLFHHYVSHVANIMMPYEHPRNPWKSHYPAVALEMASLKQNFLYSAMLAHAAFNIAHLRGNDDGFLRVGMKQYGDAIQALIHSIGQESLDFPATMASIMTLMFAEVRKRGLLASEKTDYLTDYPSSTTAPPTLGGTISKAHGLSWKNTASPSRGSPQIWPASHFKASTLLKSLVTPRRVARRFSPPTKIVLQRPHQSYLRLDLGSLLVHQSPFWIQSRA